MKGDMDLLMASIALAEKAVFVTDDRALHDDAVPGPVVENWLAG